MKSLSQRTGGNLSQATGRGPVEVVEFKGVKVPVYLTPAFGKESYTLSYYANGKRIRERAGTLEEARRQAKDKIKDLTEGTAHVGNFTPKQTATISDAMDVLKEIGVPLSQVAREYAEALKILAGRGSIVEAAKIYVATQAARDIRPKRVSEVVDEFLLSIENAKLSHRYYDDCSSRLGQIKKAFGKTNIGNVTTADFETYFEGRKLAPRSFNNLRNVTVTLFAFARRRGYLPKGIATAIEEVPKRKDRGGEIGIYTPAQFRTLLENIRPEFVPYIAIGGLAGLRSAEISRLDWREIDFDQKHILVTAAKAKTASRRIVPMCESLVEILRPYRKPSGLLYSNVNPQAFDHALARAWGEMRDGEGNLLVERVPNGLRHSFGSYRLALVEDAAKVALEMGNSPRMLFQNYRQLATKGEAEKWFGSSSAV